VYHEFLSTFIKNFVVFVLGGGLSGLLAEITAAMNGDLVALF
jgi:succinate dehydrogenase/fumarate reductase flavoprotein subunit